VAFGLLTHNQSVKRTSFLGGSKGDPTHERIGAQGEATNGCRIGFYKSQHCWTEKG
jgi:hypothetical protein